MPITTASSTLSTGSSRPMYGRAPDPRPNTDSASRFHLGAASLNSAAILARGLRVSSSRFVCQFADCLLENLSPMFVVVEHVKTRAGGREQHHIAGCCKGGRASHRTVHR